MADEGQGTQGGQGATEGGASAGAQSSTAQSSAGKTFTQEQLDAIIADRLTRERGKYADYEDLKKAAAKLKDIEAANLTDQQKLQKQVDELGSANAALLTQVRTAKAVSAVATAGARYPDLVAGKVPADVIDDPAKLDAAIKDLKKQYPDLFRGGAAGGSADGGAGGRAPGGASMNDFIRKAAGR